MNWPCQECRDRVPGCHDHCQRYQEKRAKLDTMREERRQSRALAEITERRVARAMREKMRKARSK